MGKLASDEGLDLVFREARTHTPGSTSRWTTPCSPGLRPRQDGADLRQHVPDADRLREVARGEGEAQARLDAGNVDKTMDAPVTAPSSPWTFTSTSSCRKLYPARRREGLVQGPARNRAGVHRPAQLVAARRVLHAGRPGPGPGLRPDVRLRQRQGGRRLLRRTTVKSNFLCNLGHRRRRASFTRAPGGGLRQSVPDRVTDCRTTSTPSARSAEIHCCSFVVALVATTLSAVGVARKNRR